MKTYKNQCYRLRSFIRRPCDIIYQATDEPDTDSGGADEPDTTSGVADSVRTGSSGKITDDLTTGYASTAISNVTNPASKAPPLFTPKTTLTI